MEGGRDGMEGGDSSGWLGEAVGLAWDGGSTGVD